jgi:hypothetical protein
LCQTLHVSSLAYGFGFCKNNQPLTQHKVSTLLSPFPDEATVVQRE